ncbi:transposase [Holospora elegans]|uniref:transposase n=1 Tax=Holospora elegans TaxID=431043 RepID=UPI000695E3A4
MIAAIEANTKKESVNAVFYIIKSDCQWRMRPKDFPPYSTVHSFCRPCRIKGVWGKVIIADLNMQNLAATFSEAFNQR